MSSGRSVFHVALEMSALPHRDTPVSVTGDRFGGKPCCSRQRATVRRTRFDTREDLAGSLVARATVVSVRPNIEARWMTLGPFEAGSLLEVTMDPDRHREGLQPMASR